MAKDKVAKVAKVAKEKVEKIERNGVTHPVNPKEGVGLIWAICDKLYDKKNEVPTREAILKEAQAKGLNASTTSTQYARWRKFHGHGTAPRPVKKEKSK